MAEPVADNKDLKIIADLVYNTCGIVFKDSNLAVLSSRLSSKLKEKGKSTVEYVAILQNDQKELLSFIDFVTTNFTSFFRNPKQFETLKEDILPVLIKRNEVTKHLKIWSAACSSGEEPYTLAMVIDEYLRENRLTGWTYQITGSDISL